MKGLRGKEGDGEEDVGMEMKIRGWRGKDGETGELGGRARVWRGRGE